MNLVKHIAYVATSVKAYPRAWKFISDKRLAHFFLYPIVVAVGLFFITSTFYTTASEKLLFMALDAFDAREYENAWFITAAKWIMRLGFWMLFQSINRYLVFIFMSPILAFISEKVNELASGERTPFNVNQLVSDIIRGVGLAVRNLTLELIFTFGLWLLTLFVPVLLPFSLIATLIIQCYFYGFGFIDYNLERYKFKRGESVEWMRQHFGLAFGIGIGFYILFAIPYVGWILAPVLSCVAATLAFRKVFLTTSPLEVSNHL